MAQGVTGMPHRRNIDIDLLQSFVTIIEVKSFTRAAERLLSVRGSRAACREVFLFVQELLQVTTCPPGEAEAERELVDRLVQLCASVQAQQDLR
jgi:hypothetical protein